MEARRREQRWIALKFLKDSIMQFTHTLLLSHTYRIIDQNAHRESNQAPSRRRALFGASA